MKFNTKAFIGTLADILFIIFIVLAMYLLASMHSELRETNKKIMQTIHKLELKK